MGAGQDLAAGRTAQDPLVGATADEEGQVRMAVAEPGDLWCGIGGAETLVEEPAQAVIGDEIFELAQLFPP